MPDNALLQLYDLQGNRRLTETEEKERLATEQKNDVLKQLKQAQAKIVNIEQAQKDLERKLEEALQKLRDVGLA